jgi:dynein intermediate chain 2
MEDLKTPIMTTRYHSSYLTDGCWSPTRPGVFFTTKKDGTLDIWDYFFKQNDPTFSVQVADAGLHCLRVENQGRFIATGSFDGSTTLLEICESLAVIQQNEKQNMIQMFERETKRCVNMC